MPNPTPIEKLLISFEQEYTSYLSQTDPNLHLLILLASSMLQQGHVKEGAEAVRKLRSLVSGDDNKPGNGLYEDKIGSVAYFSDPPAQPMQNPQDAFHLAWFNLYWDADDDSEENRRLCAEISMAWGDFLRNGKKGTNADAAQHYCDAIEECKFLSRVNASLYTVPLAEAIFAYMDTEPDVRDVEDALWELELLLGKIGKVQTENPEKYDPVFMYRAFRYCQDGNYFIENFDSAYRYMTLSERCYNELSEADQDKYAADYALGHLHLLNYWGEDELKGPEKIAVARKAVAGFERAMTLAEEREELERETVLLFQACLHLASCLHRRTQEAEFVQIWQKVHELYQRFPDVFDEDRIYGVCDVLVPYADMFLVSPEDWKERERVKEGLDRAEMDRVCRAFRPILLRENVPIEPVYSERLGYVLIDLGDEGNPESAHIIDNPKSLCYVLFREIVWNYIYATYQNVSIVPPYPSEADLTTIKRLWSECTEGLRGYNLTKLDIMDELWEYYADVAEALDREREEEEGEK